MTDNELKYWMWHPMCSNLLRRGFENSVLEFRQYTVGEWTDTKVTMPLRKVSEIQKLLLQPQQELALSSILSCGRFKWHLPMANTVRPIDPQTFVARAESVLGKPSLLTNLKRPIYYDSGRGGHLYWLAPITEDDWRRFMGELLLVSASSNDFVDIKWIGQSLRNGYSSLRWTNNSGTYQKIPELKKIFCPGGPKTYL